MNQILLLLYYCKLSLQETRKSLDWTLNNFDIIGNVNHNFILNDATKTFKKRR